MKELLTEGTQISHYRILSRLGAGGMGEVYKAHDTILDRAVALKILPADLTEDADRLRRFVQEAKSASALNHPHIITIYEVGQAHLEAEFSRGREGEAIKETAVSTKGQTVIHYMAMEFIDGDTLQTKIHRDKTELKRLLEYFVQVAEGLAKAHGSGIVHRDLKPDNVMVTQDGYAKILDFGLVKLIEPKRPESVDDLEEAATMMMESRTQPGMVMGTLGYMSPEQVQGKAVDQRSDIFSFGCILYEAATRHKPFAGDSMIDSLHRIVYAQAPPIVEFNPEAPAELQRIIRKCLAKNPDERYQSIKDAALDLRALVREYEMQPPVTGSYPAAQATGAYPYSGSFPPVASGQMTASQMQSGQVQSGQMPAALTAEKRSPVRWIVIASVAALVIAALSFAAYKLIHRTTSTPGTPFEKIKVTRLTNTGNVRSAAISPDGKYVVHVVSEAGQRSLWVRQVATSSNVQIIPPSEAGYGGLTFSRDGNYIYYVRVEKGSPIGELYQLPVLGGSPKKLLADVDSAVTFSPDGSRMAFVRNSVADEESTVMVAVADGTGEQKIVSHKLTNGFTSLDWSPDGKVIAACSVVSDESGRYMNVIELQVEDGTERAITSQRWLVISAIEWLADGSGLVMNSVDEASRLYQIWHLAYPGGEARRITNDLNNYVSLNITSDARAFVTVQNQAITNIWAAPNGDASRAKQITSGAGNYSSVVWFGEGKILYAVPSGANIDLWAMNADGTNQKQITSDANVNIYPSVTPDGRYIVFCSNRGNRFNTFHIWRMNKDGSDAKQLTSGTGELYPSCSPDGQWVAFMSVSSGKPVVMKVSMEGGEPAQLTDKFSANPVVSPDGKFIACYYWDPQISKQGVVAVIPSEGGQPVKSFTNVQGQFQWNTDGRALIYLDNKAGISNIWSQPLDGGPPKQLTDFKSDLIFYFDWSRDGKQLVASRGINTTDAIMISDAR